MSARLKPYSGRRHFARREPPGAVPLQTWRMPRSSAVSLDLESEKTETGCPLPHTNLPLLKDLVRQLRQAGAWKREHPHLLASFGSLRPQANHSREVAGR